MIMIDADVLLKDVERLIQQHEDMKKECEKGKRYRLYLDTENEIMGMRTVEYLIKLSAGIVEPIVEPCYTMEGEGNETD